MDLGQIHLPYLSTFLSLECDYSGTYVGVVIRE